MVNIMVSFAVCYDLHWFLTIICLPSQRVKVSTAVYNTVYNMVCWVSYGFYCSTLWFIIVCNGVHAVCNGLSWFLLHSQWCLLVGKGVQ